jgi:hypothetical protein
MTKQITRAMWTLCAIAFLFVSVLAHPLAERQEPQQPASTPREVRGASVKSKADLRAKTDDEKARAKFFDRYGADPLEPGDTAVIGPGTPAPPIPPGVPLPTVDQFLEHLACSPQMVVLGRAEHRATRLNQRESYLFTDYDVDVERWLRPEQGTASLKLSVSGGRVTIAGRPTVAGAQDPLDPTKRYIFFLQHIPGSGSLTPVRPPLADGDRWATAVRDLSLIPELADANVRLESLADDLSRLGRTCAPGRGR